MQKRKTRVRQTVSEQIYESIIQKNLILFFIMNDNILQRDKTEGNAIIEVIPVYSDVCFYYN